MAEISISDNGKGISDEEKKKVFDKFYCGEKKMEMHYNFCRKVLTLTP